MRTVNRPLNLIDIDDVIAITTAQRDEGIGLIRQEPVSIEEIKIIITKLKKKNIAVLIKDHKVRETLKIVDRVYIVNEGIIYFSGNPSEAISDERIKKFYLGSNFSI